MSNLNRREFAFGAGAVAAAVAASAVAQPADPRKVPPEKVGEAHGKELDRARKALGGKSAVSEEGMHLLIEELVRLELISRDDAASLHDMVKGIHNGKRIEDIEQAIEAALKRKAGELTQVIANIAKNSLKWVREHLGKVDLPKWRFIIANDTTGALQGAGGAALATAITGIAAGPAAIVCAVIGASASSLIAVNDYKP